jgi:hypothetical protein
VKDKFSKSTRSDSPERKTFLKSATRNIESLEIRCNRLLLRYRSSCNRDRRPKSLAKLRCIPVAWCSLDHEGFRNAANRF